MNKKISSLFKGTLLLSFVFSALGLYAQGEKPVSTLFTAANSVSLQDKVVKDYQALDLDLVQLAQIFQERPNQLTLILPSKQGNIVLSLTSVQLLDPDFNVQNERKEIIPYTPGVYYRGTIQSATGKNYAAISIFEKSVMGMFGDDRGDFVLGALSAKGEIEGTSHYILYNDKNLLIPNTFKCETANKDDNATHKHVQSNNPTGVNTSCVKVHFDADFALYQAKSSNVTTTTNYVTGLFNMVTTLYQAEGISTVLNDVDVWTGQDPFSSASSLDALYDYGDYTQNNLQGASLAHLLSGVNAGNGGIAWVGVLCYPYDAASHAGPYAYSNIDGVFSTVPTFSWDVEVTTHEMGHNLGSNHTHWCGWVGGAIDDCYATEPEPSTAAACAPGPTPSNGGTIMSYCHLSSTGINFNNGFGTQPNAVIVDAVNTAACLPACTTPVSYCSGLTTYTACSGSFTDGSGTNNYGDNANCEWLIQRPNGVVKITFSSINLEANADYVRVYDGTSSAATLLYTGTGVLSNIIVTSTGPNIYVLFTSNASVGAAGFAATYSGLPIKPIITGTTTFCPGASTTLTVSPTYSGVSYSWSTGQTGASISVSSPMSVTVTGTNACGSTISAAANVTAATLPTANAGVDKTICLGSSTTLGTTAVAGTTYAWTPTTGLSSATVSNPTANPTTTTTYILTATKTGCTKKDTVKVTVNPLPTASAGVNKSICKGSSVSIGATAVAGMTYTWSPSTGLSSAFVSNPVATPTVTTSYILTVVNAATGCLKKDTVIVTVNTVPIAYGGVDKVLCKGSSAVLGTSAVSGVTYSWTPSTGLSSALVSNPTATPTVTTTYYLTATQTTGGCTKKDTVKVTVNPVPTATAGTDKAICKGSSVTLGTTAVAGMTYTWTPATTLSSAYISNPVATPTTTTNYILTVVNPTTGCLKKDTVIVTANTVPTANAGLDKTICKGVSTILGTTAVSGVTYLWSPITGLSSSVVSNPTATPTVTTTYYLTATQTVGGCTKKDTVKVTVNPVPTATAGTDKAICKGSSVTLGTTAVAGINYTWSPTTALSSAFVSNPVASPTVTTNYIINAVNAITGCAKKDTVKVTVNTVPVANAGLDKTICKGVSTILGTTAVSGVTYLWSPITGLSSSVVSNPTATPTVTTTYYLTATQTVGGCTKKDTVKVTVNPVPTAVAGTDKSICKGASVILGTTAVAGINYTWSPTTALSSAFVSNPSATPTITTSYILNAVNATTGCSKKDTVKVTVNPLPTANAGVDLTICVGSSAVIGATSTLTGITYTWSPATTLSSAFVSNPTATPTVTTSYFLNVVSSAGCSKKDTVKVTVNPAPTANAGLDKSIILGGSTLIGTTGIAGNTYTWTPATGLSNAFIATPTASPTSTTTYTLTVKITATGCTKKDAMVLTVTPSLVGASDNSQKMASNSTANVHFSAYPNPVEDVLHIVSDGNLQGNVEMLILNNLGQVIHRHVFDADNQLLDTELRMNDLTKGMYFLHIQAENARQMIQIVKE